jgi:hypothetical protein
LFGSFFGVRWDSLFWGRAARSKGLPERDGLYQNPGIEKLPDAQKFRDRAICRNEIVQPCPTSQSRSPYAAIAKRLYMTKYIDIRVNRTLAHAIGPYRQPQPQFR